MVSSEQRRKQLAREKFLRQQERRAARRRKARIRNVGIACGLALVIAAGAAYASSGGLNGDEKSKENTAADKATASPSKAPDPCGKPAKGKPGKERWKKEPAMETDASASYAMRLDTTCGRIGVRLDAAKAPHTVNSFRFLAGQHFLDHTRCHRLVDQNIHVLQCGDPTGTGQGGPGYTIPDENLKDPAVEGGTYPAGTVAMANEYDARSGKGRDSGGSQFFLVFEDSKLSPDYTPFGRITGGMDVLKKIAKAGASTDPQTGGSPPNATVVINRATVRKS